MFIFVVFQLISNLITFSSIRSMTSNSIISRVVDDLTKNVEIIRFENVSLSYNERIALVFKAWISKKNIKSRRRIAAEFDISKFSFNDRINDERSKTQRDQNLQRVWAVKKIVIIETLTRLQTWDWSARMQHVRFMTQQLLQAKNDMKSLNKFRDYMTASY